MKKYYITEKSGMSFEINLTYHIVKTQSFIAYKFLTQKNEILLFNIENQSIQTHLDLSNFHEYLVVGLEADDNKWQIKSIIHSFADCNGNFSILTPFKKILCIPINENYKISKWDYVSINNLNELSTWAYELATRQEEHIFVYHKLACFNLVIRLSSIQSPHLKEMVSTFYELNNFDRDIIILKDSNYTISRLREIANEFLLPNGLKEKEDFCFLEDYVVSPRFNFTQHPECIDLTWLSGYLHPATADFDEGNYIHYCTNALTKKIVFMFYQYMKRNHYRTYKNGLKVILLRDGYIYFSLERDSHFEAKLPLIYVINDDCQKYEHSDNFEHLHYDDLIKWKLYCSILKDNELIEFYNCEIHKMGIKEDGRYLYINALKDEIKSRSFDSEVLDKITKAGYMDNLFYRKLKINEENILVLKDINQQ